MSWFSEAFGPGKSPSGEANKYYDQIPGAAGSYYNDYINRGKTAGDKLTGKYDNMLDDPGGFYDNIGKGYKESEGYKFKLQQAMNQGANASARGGMLGTPQDQQYSMQTANDIAAQDFNDYMDRVLGIFDRGQKGEERFDDQGFQGSQDMADIIAKIKAQQGNNAFSETAGKNAGKSNNWSNVFKGVGAGAGFALGGPAGALLGGGLGSSMYGGG